MEQKSIRIGYLPLLDHIVLSIALENSGELLDSIEPVQFSSWDSIATALSSGEIDGAFILFPLAYKLFLDGVPLQLLLLGHREGQSLIVDESIHTVHDLFNKTISVPHNYSTHHILLHQILKQNNLNINKDINLRVGYNDARTIANELVQENVNGMIYADPLATQFRDKVSGGHILKLSKDFNSHHIDCVFVMNTQFVIEKERIQILINEFVKAGMFVTAYPRTAAEIAEKPLGWSKSILLKGLTHDEGHILFWDLAPRVEDFEDLYESGKELHLWKENRLAEFIHPSFALQAYRTWVLSERKSVKDRGSSNRLPANSFEASQLLFSHIGNFPIALVRPVMVGTAYSKICSKKGLVIDLLELFLNINNMVNACYKTSLSSKEIKAIELIEIIHYEHEHDGVVFVLDEDEFNRSFLKKYLHWNSTNSTDELLCGKFELACLVYDKKVALCMSKRMFALSAMLF